MQKVLHLRRWCSNSSPTHYHLKQRQSHNHQYQGHHPNQPHYHPLHQDHHIRAARLESYLSSNSASECPGDDGTCEPQCNVMLCVAVHCTALMLLVRPIGLNSMLHVSYNDFTTLMYVM